MTQSHPLELAWLTVRLQGWIQPDPLELPGCAVHDESAQALYSLLLSSMNEDASELSYGRDMSPPQRVNFLKGMRFYLDEAWMFSGKWAALLQLPVMARLLTLCPAYTPHTIGVLVVWLRVWLHPAQDAMATDADCLRAALRNTAALAGNSTHQARALRQMSTDFELWCSVGTGSDGRVLLPPRLLPCVLALLGENLSLTWHTAELWAAALWRPPCHPVIPTQLPVSVWSTGDAARVMCNLTPASPPAQSTQLTDAQVLQQGFMGREVLRCLDPALASLPHKVLRTMELSAAQATALYHTFCAWAQVWITFEAQLRCPDPDVIMGPPPDKLSVLATMQTGFEFRHPLMALYANASHGNSRVMSLQMHHTLSHDPVQFSDIQLLQLEDHENMPPKAAEVERKRRKAKRQRREAPATWEARASTTPRSPEAPSAVAQSTPLPLPLPVPAPPALPLASSPCSAQRRSHTPMRGVFGNALELDLDCEPVRANTPPRHFRQLPRSARPCTPHSFARQPLPRMPLAPRSASAASLRGRSSGFTYTEYMQKNRLGD